VTDNSSGIFFTAEDGGLDWLWRVIEETVSLFINDFKEFMKRGGQAFVGEQIRVRVRKISMFDMTKLQM